MNKKILYTAFLFLSCLCFSSTLVNAQANNLLNNSYADDRTDHWTADGEATIEVINGNPAFVVRNGGHFSQEITLSDDLSGEFMLIIGMVLSERSNSNRNITGLPYFYAYELEEIQTNDYSELFINKYLKVTDMLYSARDIYEWVLIWDIFQISESTNTIELFLMQAERMGVPHNGSAARFDDLGVYFFSSVDEAESFVNAY
jgi:hypothetical protein